MQTSLKLSTLLPLPPESWDYRGVPPHPAFPHLFAILTPSTCFLREAFPHTHTNFGIPCYILLFIMLITQSIILNGLSVALTKL
jgi:hypothetical protein